MVHAQRVEERALGWRACQWVCFLLGAVGLSTLTLAAPAAGVKESSIATNVGCSKELSLYRAGHWWPVYVTVHNEGPDFAGTVIISPDKGKLGKAHLRFETRFCRRVALPKGTTKRVPVPVFLAWNVPGWQVEVVSDDGRRFMDTALPVVGVQPRTEELVLVVADRRGAHAFFRQQASRWAHEPQVRGRHVVYADPERVPINWLLMAGYDCIVVDNIPAGLLNRDQLSAIAEYGLQGGNLVIAAGPNALWMRDSPLERVLPVRVTGLANRDVAGEVARRFAIVAPPRRAMAAATAELRDGIVLARCGRNPLVVRSYCGRGTVTFLGFGLSSPATDPWLGKENLAPVLMQPKRISALSTTLHGVAQEGMWRVAEKHSPRADVLAKAESAPLAKFPPAGQVALFLAVYLVALSPLTYLIFRKAERLELAWLLSPALAVTFAVVPYVIDAGRAGAKASIHNTCLVETANGQRTGLCTRVLVAYSPRAAEHRIRFPEQAPLVADFHPADAQEGGLDTVGLDVAFGEETRLPKLTILRQSVRSFATQDTLDMRGAMSVTAGGAPANEITVRHSLPTALRRACFFAPALNYATWLGDVSRGKQTRAAAEWVDCDTASAKMVGETADAEMRRRLLATTIDALRGSATRCHGYLMAWYDVDTVLETNGRRADVTTTGLIVVHVPMSGRSRPGAPPAASPAADVHDGTVQNL